ncbi:DEAD/DEAH box helicase [Bartonella tribocorum]|uniref:Helicase/methyltransferase n=1 Tax=Bartonella tribocorum (strain DSM 28219 / CCUG 45778 / CIP 105476 / IBS 506) TaxID=382640 RepID=A9ITV9_BART1|nr:type ISP restriction/modification enzyme [Bartonella tribocorum]CAK01480.1 helicase/methyltransferase [Bartonella tribocorum CIP 105476]CDO48720.1 helicase/methyltransferase [Bartonella tribocorum]
MLQSLKSDHEHVTLRSLLEYYRQQAKSLRELGTLFENLVIAYLTKDPLHYGRYEKVETYYEWAKEREGWNKNDIGIDLVAKLRNQEGYVAIQCKFYQADHQISKKDIDSFIAASGKDIFKYRLLVDSTEVELSDNVNAMIKGQAIPVYRIDLRHMENSRIDWQIYATKKEVLLKSTKKPRPHQEEAIKKVCEGLKEADRGKLIMACGTGKTFTSLKIAETLAGKGKRVLFLVPSLALVSQTIREWTTDAQVPLRSFAVCSDTKVGKRRKNQEDIVGMETSDLVLPATTDAQALAKEACENLEDAMTVVFSTYHSIQVISDAQKEHGLPEFDLIICDEAHRTTGASLGSEDNESEFIKVHDNSIIRGKKRLYMTATPRIFSDTAKRRADEINAVLASMDDETLFGKQLHHYTFAEAVDNELLTPYKIVVLGINETYITPAIQEIIANENREIDLDDAAKIIGCYRALTKIDKQAAIDDDDTEPMQCALAFCKDINTSQYITKLFNKIIKSHIDDFLQTVPFLNCEVRHIDGTQSVKKRNEELDWLKEDTGQNVCRILSNVRCLSEGIDVPALDAIMFLHPRNSQVDVIQAVGRVMRRAPNKKTGYIILPIIIPSHLEAKKALKNNKRYRVIWQVLDALHSHDERLARTINQMSLGQDSSHTIEIIEIKRANELQELTTTVDEISIPSKTESSGHTIGTAESKTQSVSGGQGDLFPRSEFFDFVKAIFLDSFKITDYWGIWANNVAEIAQNHINHLKDMISDEKSEAFHAFDAFHKELKNNVNSEIKKEEAIEMLAQHLVTRPVFEALFDGNEFVQNNAISQAMDKILTELDKTNIEEKTKDLDKFYKSVTFCTAGITETHAKQNLIIKLYESFFAKAFKKTTDKLGIVYTPVKVVDFIIHSVDDVLRNEFGKSLGSRGVSILDPFTGTGTFITRLLQSNLIKPEDMEYKFRHDIHANEIVLLAYYIAAINIETTYHSLMKGEYIPFKHIGLTDTFRMLEEKNLLQELFKENSEYLEYQKKLDIKVIFGNPPYSVGQKNENDNAKNTPYPILDNRIRETYAAQSKVTNIRALYDSYIRAIRWASDRIDNAGVIGFVSGSGYIDKPTMDSLRKSLAKEFTSIYVLNLRGDIRKNMMNKNNAQEGENVFGNGSMTGIAVTLFIKNPNVSGDCKIYYHDIGDNLTTKEKLTALEYFGSIGGVMRESGWQLIKPDEHGDWIKQRDDSFATFLTLGDKKGNNNKKLFETFSRGIITTRDIWAYNASHQALANNMSNMIAFYNSEVERFNDAYTDTDRKKRAKAVNDFVNTDERKISWSRALKQDLVKGKIFEFEETYLTQSLYRPFTRQWLYYSRTFNEMVYQIPRIFPMEKVVENMVIQVASVGTMSGFSVLMSKDLPNLHAIDTGQCFPRYIYEDTTVSESKNERQSHLFTEANTTAGLQRRDAITDEGLAHFKAAYPNEKITKDDLFYYVYGLLHSEDYRARYADNLCKELPRIPCVKNADDFWKFVTAGRELGHLHVNYEDVEPYPVTFKKGNPKLTDISNPEKFYYVTEMKFAGNSKEKDKSTVIYNSNITITDIPLEAYEYIVNGKPALEWVMGRQCVKTDKKSGIVNDANRYAVETIGNPAYPLELFQRVITVSLETMKIVKNLPKLEIRETE